ncbi:DUF3616 domain-containing protein [Polaromonas glacialis]|uniref:DUF3616 domain-containing protein n=1 Tax=Polaromonas glacialis TaxID=866564 RepID=UPI0009FEDC33|nr:DUF3616 domain-containing protein [Polaromonas glacialis]
MTEERSLYLNNGQACHLHIKASFEKFFNWSRLFAARMLAPLWLIVGICASGMAHAAPLDAPVLKPDSGPWSTGEGFNIDEKTRRSVSGIACVPSLGDRVCLVVFDEGIEARHAVLKKDMLLPQSEHLMLLGSGSELDAEGAASDGRNFYVTGSHSMSRTRCAPNPDSRHVIRFSIDPKTSRAMRDHNGKLSGYQASGRLWEILSSQEGFKQYLGKCLGTQPPEKSPELKGEQGINIEGLAVKDGLLYFGFRGPAQEGAVPILSVKADALFSDLPLKPATFRLAVGQGRGIRDLLAVKDGFLVLTGPDDDERKKQPSSMLLFWNGKDSTRRISNVKPLANLDLSKIVRSTCDKVAKPEALALISESAREYKVLVLSDGMCDGGPLAFTVTRR